MKSSDVEKFLAWYEDMQKKVILQKAIERCGGVEKFKTAAEQTKAWLKKKG